MAPVFAFLSVLAVCGTALALVHWYVAPAVARVLDARAAAAQQRAAERMADLVEIPKHLRAIAEQESEAWAQAETLARFRELYAEHGDWARVATAYEAERRAALESARAMDGAMDGVLDMPSTFGLVS